MVGKNFQRGHTSCKAQFAARRMRGKRFVIPTGKAMHIGGDLAADNPELDRREGIFGIFWADHEPQLISPLLLIELRGAFLLVGKKLLLCQIFPDPACFILGDRFAEVKLPLFKRQPGVAAV